MWNIFGNSADKNKTVGEYARVIDWTPAWSSGAPVPKVFSDGCKTWLIYSTDIANPLQRGKDKWVLVEFIQPFTHRFGTVNDEAASGHPLYTKGLNTYAAHVVENSSWIKELKAIHKVHPRFSEQHWLDKTHFLLFFHDEMFEIIAEACKIEVLETSFLEMATDVVKRMNA